MNEAGSTAQLVRAAYTARRIYIPAMQEASMNFSKAASDTMTYLASVRKYAVRTIDNYRLTCDQFVAYLRGRGLDDSLAHFNVANTMGFCTYLGGLGVSSNTLSNKLCALSSVAQFQMKQEGAHGKPRIMFDPTKGFEPPRRTEPETKFLLPQDLAKFLAADVYPYQALVRDFMLDTGLRASEACDASVGDLQEINGAISIKVKVKGRKQANAAPAVVPLSAECATKVRDALLARGAVHPNDPVLVNARGERFNRCSLGECIAWIGVRAGITGYRVSPHKLRHTANVIANFAGIDETTRAGMLNHRGRRSLARYDHLLPGAVQAARERQRAAQATYTQAGQEAKP